MYVAQLDRPWLETPFVLQGFFLQEQSDIDLVSKHCAYVYVDPRRRTELKHLKHKVVKEPTRNRNYRDVSSLKSEFTVAVEEYESATVAVGKVFDELRRGRHLNLKLMRSAIDPLIDSVIRNSEAMAALVRLKSKGDYLYHHSLANAVWVAVLGRHLGLEPGVLKRAALAVAVMDVGMTRLEESVLGNAGKLDEADIARIHDHVGLGIELLKSSGEVDPAVLSVVAGHHERHDGSGYPKGLKDSAIPLLARIAGLVDSYDAMITARPHAPARSSFEAMQELSDRKDELFQGELVEQFMQAIGLFPTGSVVELSSGEVAIVVAQNETRRLRPKVVVVLDENKQRYSRLVIIDLSSYEAGGHKSDMWVKKELQADAYGLRPDEFFL
jgi:HD-GYP domain-containing protein (c-di-GMP phosphodiesterase class II)